MAWEDLKSCLAASTAHCTFPGELDWRVEVKKNRRSCIFLESFSTVGKCAKTKSVILKEKKNDFSTLRWIYEAIY